MTAMTEGLVTIDAQCRARRPNKPIYVPRVLTAAPVREECCEPFPYCPECEALIDLYEHRAAADRDIFTGELRPLAFSATLGRARRIVARLLAARAGLTFDEVLARVAGESISGKFLEMILCSCWFARGQRTASPSYRLSWRGRRALARIDAGEGRS